MADEVNDDELVNPEMPYSEYYKVQPVMLDMIQQFKDGKFNKALADALDEQLEDLREACYSISAYMNLNYAKGKLLDALGDILNLTRAQAALLVSTEEFTIMEDEDYRKYLRYKALLNTSQGTYQNIVDEIKLILGDEYNISFTESPDDPATVVIEIDSDDGVTELDKLPILKPAGVEIDFSSTPYKTEIHISHDIPVSEAYGICCGMVHKVVSSKRTGTYNLNDTWRCGQYPAKHVSETEAYSIYQEEVDENGNIYGE